MRATVKIAPETVTTPVACNVLGMMPVMVPDGFCANRNVNARTSKRTMVVTGCLKTCGVCCCPAETDKHKTTTKIELRRDSMAGETDFHVNYDFLA